MTKLQYLRARNKGLVRLDRLPRSVRTTLEQLIHADNIELHRSHRTGNVWRSRPSPVGTPLDSDVVYRVKDTLRPKGIPEDIHRRYDT